MGALLPLSLTSTASCCSCKLEGVMTMSSTGGTAGARGVGGAPATHRERQLAGYALQHDGGRGRGARQTKPPPMSGATPWLSMLPMRGDVGGGGRGGHEGSACGKCLARAAARWRRRHGVPRRLPPQQSHRQGHWTCHMGGTLGGRVGGVWGRSWRGGGENSTLYAPAAAAVAVGHAARGTRAQQLAVLHAAGGRGYFGLPPPHAVVVGTKVCTTGRAPTG